MVQIHTLLVCNKKISMTNKWFSLPLVATQISVCAWENRHKIIKNKTLSVMLHWIGLELLLLDEDQLFLSHTVKKIQM